MPDEEETAPRRRASSRTAARDPRDAVLALRDEVAKVVVGQEGAMSGLVAALLVRGHVLLEGVPGVAKTLLAKALAASLDLDFARVQFTPDLMPADVIGQLIFSQVQAAGAAGDFRFREGPVFTNLLLADDHLADLLPHGQDGGPRIGGAGLRQWKTSRWTDATARATATSSSSVDTA